MSVLWKANVTVAAIVEHDGRFLLVEEQTADGVRLNQPAGHLDPGETLIEAVQREALEETACPFHPNALLGVYLARSRPAEAGESVTYVRFAFVGSVDAPKDQPLDHDIVRTLWLDADQIRSRTEQHRSPLVMKCVEDYLAGQRFPLSVVYAHPSVLR